MLVLYANRRDARIVTVGDRELPRILNDGHPAGVDYYSEFIDQNRFAETDYVTAFADFLRLKYGGHAFDLIIAMDDNSREFLETTRQDLFPSVPVVFFSLRPAPRRLPNSTAVVGELNLAATLALATELQPDLRHVFVVSGAETSNFINERVARAQFSGLRAAPRLHLFVRPLERGARGPSGGAARALDRLLPDRVSGRAGQERRAARLSGSSRRRRERPDLLLGRLRDGPWHCRRQPAQPGCAGRRRRRDGAAGAARRGRGQHPGCDGGSECAAGRLAAAPALGDQRVACSAGHPGPFPGTDGLGSLSRLHRRRRSRCSWRRRRSSARCSSSERGAAARKKGSSQARPSCARATSRFQIWAAA